MPLGEGVVLLLRGIRELEAFREVHLDEHEPFRGVVLELLLAEYFRIELLAPAAPVGAGEVNQQILALLRGGRLGLFKVADPQVSGGKSGCGERPRSGGDDEGTQDIHRASIAVVRTGSTKNGDFLRVLRGAGAAHFTVPSSKCERVL